MKFKGIYVRNVDAVDIKKFAEGEREKISCNWSGYIPYSLELLKLQQEGLQLLKYKRKKLKNPIIENGKEKKFGYIRYFKKLEDDDLDTSKNNSRNKTLDIVNVYFKTNYKNSAYVELLKINKKLKLEKLNDKEKEELNIRKEQLKNEVDKLDKDKIDINRDRLRKELYEDGFEDENKIEYVMYSRSSAKSRQGKVTFIRKELYENMHKWTHMGINFPANKPIDVVSVSAYTTLVSSSIEDTIKIDPKSVLLIEGIESEWQQECKSIEFIDGELRVIHKENGGLTSCPTDGNCLFDKSYFEEGIDFKLLRQHMFKSCAFKTDIQLFFKDYCNSNNIEYETFKVKNMFGDEMLAKDVKMICTPNSCKFLKFSQFVSNSEDDEERNKDMFEHWKNIVEEDENVFGVCKHNHQSKWTFNDVEYQQMSYQMLNSLPLSKDDMQELFNYFEKDYVYKLKNNIDTFKNYLERKESAVNSNRMMLEILNKNSKFKQTELFKEFRTKVINRYVETLQKGKIKIKGDNCTLIANPMCYLKQAIGKYNENDLELKNNEVYTKLFADNEELTLFRNPCVSQFNVYVGVNTYNGDIDKYFDFGKNIIVVNCIDNAICQILSHMNFDSDLVLVTNNETILKAAKECYNKYLVCECGIKANKRLYCYNNEELCKIDNRLAHSKSEIGITVNTGQLAMSKYWDLKSKKMSDELLDNIQKQVDKCTILSGIAIDGAKKDFGDIKINKQLRSIKKELNIDKKPNFFAFIQEQTKIDKCRMYNTSMDYLLEVLKSIKDAKRTDKIDLKILLDDNIDKNKANRKQLSDLIEEVEKLKKKKGLKFKEIAEANAKEDKSEKYNEIADDVIETVENNKSKKLTKETVYAILCLIAQEGQTEKVEKVRSVKLDLLNLVFNMNKKVVLSCFKNQ